MAIIFNGNIGKAHVLVERDCTKTSITINGMLPTNDILSVILSEAQREGHQWAQNMTIGERTKMYTYLHKELIGR